MGESPYRIEHHVMLCPRCGDVFQELFRGVSSCLRCEGLWLAQPTIDRAFKDPNWPGGPSAWWRRELNCPVCLIDGNANLMAAILDGNVVIDRCRGHGLWLDAGELGRVLQTEDNGIGELYARLYGVEMPSDMLRALTGEEIAQSRARAAEMKRFVDGVLEQRRKDTQHAQQERADWLTACGEAQRRIASLEAQLVRKREEIRTHEQDLVVARALLRDLESKPPKP